MTDVGRAPAPVAAIEAFEVPGDPAARVAFSGRDPASHGNGNTSLTVGEGRPASTRAALLGAVGLDPGAAVFMEQVHGRGVAVVDPSDAGRGSGDHGDAIAGVDALVTFDTDVALVVQVADCVPLLLVDPGRGVAAVHAGRRGVESDVVGAALDALAPPDPGRVAAVIGPAIGGCCYEVPAALADEVAAQVPAAAARTSWGAPALDLPQALRAGLAARGVHRVAHHGACTRCAHDRWFSHRAAPGEGRQAGVVVRRAVAPTSGVAAGSLDWST